MKNTFSFGSFSLLLLTVVVNSEVTGIKKSKVYGDKFATTFRNCSENFLKID